MSIPTASFSSFNAIRSLLSRVGLLLLTISFLLTGCESDTETGSETSVDDVQLAISSEAAQSLAAELWLRGEVQIDQFELAANALNQSVTALLSDPTEPSLASARKRWREALSNYVKLEPFLYIENLLQPELGLSSWRFYLAAWPMMPGYLDSFDVYTYTGVVNDISLSLSTETIRHQHGLTDPEEVTLGLYAIEFLLWGDKGEGTEERFKPQTEVPLALAQSGLKVQELPNNRRRELLQLQTELLVSDIAKLKSQWTTGGGLNLSYTQRKASEQLALMHQSMKIAVSSLVDQLRAFSDPENPDKLFFDRFAGQRLPVYGESITLITEQYVSDSPSLATAWLTEAQQQQLQEHLNSAANFLAADSLESIPTVAASLNEAIAILHSSQSK